MLDLFQAEIQLAEEHNLLQPEHGFLIVIAIAIIAVRSRAHEARRRVEVTAGAAGQAEESLRIAQERYSAGMGTQTQLLEAQTLRARAQQNQDEAGLDAQLSLDVVLPQLALHADEVVVAAGRAPVGIAPITLTNVTARDLERMPDVKDLPVLLGSQPSVTYYSENGNGVGYTYLRLRGFDERRVAVSINGIPQNDLQNRRHYFVELHGFF